MVRGKPSRSVSFDETYTDMSLLWLKPVIGNTQDEIVLFCFNNLL